METDEEGFFEKQYTRHDFSESFFIQSNLSYLCPNNRVLTNMNLRISHGSTNGNGKGTKQYSHYLFLKALW